MRRVGDNIHLICLLIVSSFLIKDAVSNWNRDPKKDSRIIIVIDPEEAPTPPLQMSEKFIDEKMWPELKRIAGCDPDLERPTIQFLGRDPYPPHAINGRMTSAIGRYNPQSRQVEIYKLNAHQELSDFYSLTRSTFSHSEWTVFLYMIIAHEFLHHVYTMQGVSLADQSQHIKMHRDGSLEKIADYITQELHSNGVAKSLEMWSLEGVVRSELQKESSR
jgi:hypothetical protein